MNLAPGTLINASTPFYSTGAGGSDTARFGPEANQFHDSVDGYLGFKFTTHGSAGPYDGWMRLSLPNNTAGALIRDWAYDNTGAAVPAGATPEPGSAVLLVMGMAVVGRRRRR